MPSSKSLFLLVLLGCSLAVHAAKLSPFFDYSRELEQKPLNERARSRNLDHVTGRYGQNIDEEVECESFYSKSHKKSHRTPETTKLYKAGKRCKSGYKKKPQKVTEHEPPKTGDGYSDFTRFIMVRQEAGSNAPRETFGVGDSMAINGQIYYWEDYEDDLIHERPVGNFVILCTQSSFASDDFVGDVFCTYEVELGIMTHKDNNGNPERGFAGSIEGIAAFVANGPNVLGENVMVVTATEFGFAKYKGGKLIIQEDLIEDYLYADLYLL